MLRRDVFEPDTGVLVVRVRTSDGSALPARTLAGFASPEGDARLRAVTDGAARFPDAPLGRVEATAEAEGFEPAPVDVLVVEGVPAEAVVVLTPRGRPR
jgi:hypothetical protein